jgi:hypothetical protein
MAHIYPREYRNTGPGSGAEKLLHEALRDGLNDDYFVYHGLRYTGEATAREGEADFLILHREHGFFVVECKGAGVERKRTGEWVRRRHDGSTERLRESPVAQAQRQVKDLTRLLEPRMNRMFPGLEGFPFVTGHAVAFPRARVELDGELPLDVPRPILFDSSDLQRVQDWTTGLANFWHKAATRKVPRLGPQELRRFRKKLLHPALSLVECLGAQLAAESFVLSRLSDEQIQAVEGWLENPRLRVKGGAGTGKTLIALEAAERLANEGARVLLLCFNRRLGDYLRSSVELREVDGTRLQATTFHRLCARASHLMHNKGLEVPADKQQAVAFWRDDAPCVLLEAIGDGKVGPFDAIVVDEGQDFAPAWWEVLEEMLQPDGRLLAFYDPSQEIFGRGCHVPSSWPVLTLRYNFRNTRKIAQVVSKLGDVEMLSPSSCPEGIEPDVRPLESPAKTRKALEQLVSRLVQQERVTPGQIVILTPHSPKTSCLAGQTELAGLPLTDDPAKRAGALLHLSISAFKGLESDVVILADVDPKDPRCDRNARYVAASRARHRLFVFAKGNWVT